MLRNSNTTTGTSSYSSIVVSLFGSRAHTCQIFFPFIAFTFKHAHKSSRRTSGSFPMGKFLHTQEKKGTNLFSATQPSIDFLLRLFHKINSQFFLFFAFYIFPYAHTTLTENSTKKAVALKSTLNYKRKGKTSRQHTHNNNKNKRNAHLFLWIKFSHFNAFYEWRSLSWAFRDNDRPLQHFLFIFFNDIKHSGEAFSWINKQQQAEMLFRYRPVFTYGIKLFRKFFVMRIYFPSAPFSYHYSHKSYTKKSFNAINFVLILRTLICFETVFIRLLLSGGEH